MIDSPQREERIQSHDQATDTLMEWAQEPMTSEDEAAWSELVTDRKEMAAQHVADLIDRNKGLMDDQNDTVAARQSFGNQHK